ncbi:MAG: hypothetical protein QW379_05345 [Thermoplasmata archaeon]
MGRKVAEEAGGGRGEKNGGRGSSENSGNGAGGDGWEGWKSDRVNGGGEAGQKRPIQFSGAPELQPLALLFAWFEGGDRLQFGELCASCPDEARRECGAWRERTLSGLRAQEPGTLRKCPYFLAWSSQELDIGSLTEEELREGAANLSLCPRCGKETMATAARVASEFATRLNPRLTLIHWCGCGYFATEKKELTGDRTRCVLCGGEVARDAVYPRAGTGPDQGGEAESATARGADGAEGEGIAAEAGRGGTVFRGALYHIDCFLRLRYFLATSEMLRVAQRYLQTGEPLTPEEAASALVKTLETVRAFRLTGNSNVLGVNRVIHWLEGDSPLISKMTVLRSRKALLESLRESFIGENEGSVGVHILEDAYIIYQRADEVRWITHGTYLPARGVEDFIDKYVDSAARGEWQELEPLLIREVPDGRCVLCGSMTRSHRVATGESGEPVYICHHCWTGRAKS